MGAGLAVEDECVAVDEGSQMLKRMKKTVA
jgi:hypothetical protein